MMQTELVSAQNDMMLAGWSYDRFPDNYKTLLNHWMPNPTSAGFFYRPVTVLILLGYLGMLAPRKQENN